MDDHPWHPMCYRNNLVHSDCPHLLTFTVPDHFDLYIEADCLAFNTAFLETTIRVNFRSLQMLSASSFPDLRDSLVHVFSHTNKASCGINNC